MNWYALVVRPQHEKAVAASLVAKALDSYVPLYRDRRRWSDRVRILELPLFSRYVFCRCSFADRIKVLGTPSVMSMVSFLVSITSLPFILQAKLDSVVLT